MKNICTLSVPVLASMLLLPLLAGCQSGNHPKPLAQQPIAQTPPPAPTSEPAVPAPAPAPAESAAPESAPPSAPELPAPSTPPAAKATASAKGHVAGTVHHAPGTYYVIIISTSTESAARHDAEFLAKHGVDVAVESHTSSKNQKTFYTVVSAQGFAKRTEAEALRKKIIEVGHLTPEYKRAHKAWDDAYVHRATATKKAAK